MANRDPLLTFEEFSPKGKHGSNNFFFHFFGPIGEYEMFDFKRATPPYALCMKHHKEEFESLTLRLESMAPLECPRDRTFLNNIEYQKLLYGAYVLMYSYAESNYELFK